MPPKTPAPPIDPLAAEIILAARKNPQAVLRAVETERLRRRFHPFVRAAWEALHPGSAFCDGWHIQSVCEHLEAVSRGEIQNLLLNMPPGTLKSTIIAVMWPAWQWATDPSLSWIFASYAHALSKRDSVVCRQLIESEWYRSRWGSGFALAEDQNEKMLYGTDKGGFRLATSLGSGVTGHHAARLILDDPLDARNAHSETERESANDWIDQSWYNRDLGPGVTRRVVVMQRLHMDDPTAHLLAQGNWIHLSLPMEYEPRTWTSPIGWSDPRKIAGEPLWPAMFPSESLTEYKAKGDAYWAGQYQQRPFPKGGGYFQVVKLRPNIIHARPINALSCRAWDFAATTREQSKRSAGVRMSKDHLGKIYVEHIALGKWATDERNTKMRAHADADGVKVLFEQEGGSAGVDQALAVARLLEGHAVEGIHPSGDKLVRADPYASQVNAGNVWLVDDGTWDVEAYIAELEACPNGSYWDQIDASSMAYSWLAARRVPDAPGAKALSRESPRLPSDWREEANRLGAMPADGWRDHMPRA